MSEQHKGVSQGLHIVPRRGEYTFRKHAGLHFAPLDNISRKEALSESLSLHVWEDMMDISVVLWSGLSELLTEKGEEE